MVSENASFFFKPIPTSINVFECGVSPKLAVHVSQITFIIAFRKDPIVSGLAIQVLIKKC